MPVRRMSGPRTQNEGGDGTSNMVPAATTFCIQTPLDCGVLQTLCLKRPSDVQTLGVRIIYTPTGA